jgi:hypothetical protein
MMSRIRRGLGGGIEVELTVLNLITGLVGLWERFYRCRSVTWLLPITWSHREILSGTIRCDAPLGLPFWSIARPTHVCD